MDRWADSVDNVGNNGAECECYSADPLYSVGIKNVAKGCGYKESGHYYLPNAM